MHPPSPTDSLRRELADLDPRHVAALEDPYTLLNGLREGCPVGHSDRYGGFWNLFRFNDVCAAAGDPETFSSRDVTIPSQPLPAPPNPIQIDPPEHMDFRRPLLKQFAPDKVAELEPTMRRKAVEMLETVIARGSADLADEVFIPFPAFAALQILNLPSSDFPKFARWAKLAFTVPEEGSPDLNWGLEVAAYFAPLYEACKGSDADDVPSIARRTLVQGREIDIMEFIMLLTTLVTAGLDTTANSLSQIILLLDERPQLQDQLKEAARDPKALQQAIEELLRYLTPLPMLSRVTTRDVEIDAPDGLVKIPAGQKVALHWLAANHDPREFDNPNEPLLDRTPNRHVAFGRGPHRCIGMHLARLELRVILEEFLTRVPDFRVRRTEVIRAPGITRQVLHLPTDFGPLEP